MTLNYPRTPISDSMTKSNSVLFGIKAPCPDFLKTGNSHIIYAPVESYQLTGIIRKKRLV